MATISFDTYFLLTPATPVFNFRDTSNYAGQGVSTTNLVGNFMVTSPSGVVIINHLGNQTSGTCDIDIPSSLNSVGTLPLPLSSSLVEPGVYTIYYEVYDTVTFVLSSVTQTYTFSYIAPEVCIEQNVDCLSPLFTSTDATDYTVDSVVPTKTITHTLYYPNGSAGQGAPAINATLVLTTSTFYQGTQTTTISTVLSYVYPDGLIVTDTVTGTKEVLVDCKDVCGIYCCIRSIEQQMNDFKTTNKVEYKNYSDLFAKIMGYVGLALLAIRCGKSDDVNDFLAEIRLLSHCTSDCGCEGDEPVQVTGLGGLINNIVVNSCGNGITVTPVEVGNTITYTVCLTTAFVNLVNSFYNTIVEAGNNITIVDSGIIGTTRTFTVNGRNTIVQSAGSSIVVTQVYQTSGVLVIGTKYTIATYVATDDFTNVGGTNVTGNIFIATGTTPTTWTAGSSVNITGTTTYNLEGKSDIVVAGNTSVTVTPTGPVAGVMTYTLTAFGIQRKYIKEFVTEDIEQTLTISYAEKTACEEFPLGCMVETTDPNNFVDQHVQIWSLDAAGSWTLLAQAGVAVGAGGDYELTVDATTGLITIVLKNNQGTYRVVILF